MVLDVAFVFIKDPEEGLDVPHLNCHDTVVPWACAGVAYVSGDPGDTDSPSFKSVQLDPPFVEYCTSKWTVPLVAVKIMVEVAAPFEQVPRPVDTVPLGQEDVSTVIVLKVVVPVVGFLVS